MTAPTDRWSELDRPQRRLTEGEVRRLGEAARWAPSIHNSQPWHLRRLPDGLAVEEDPARAVPVIDPDGRDRAISCGAAVLNARVALRALGYDPVVDLLPDHRDPRLLAQVRAGVPQPATPRDVALAEAIRRRHTHRRVYRSHAVAEEDLLELRGAVLAEGARLAIPGSGARRRLVTLLRQAVRDQAAHAALRREVAAWVRRGTADATDGIPLESLGASAVPVDHLLEQHSLDDPEQDGAEEELARSTVLAICTESDTRHDWVVAGLALEHLLLIATERGLVASFADQPLQNPSLRAEVGELLGGWGYPQVLLRVGRALVETPPTPRRPLTDLFN